MSKICMDNLTIEALKNDIKVTRTKIVVIMVEFVSYDGKYPCLCMGTLTILVDGNTYRFNHAMISGGCILRNEDWDMWAEKGDWEIDLEEHPELESYKEEITRVVNENVPQGCCGGCI